MREETVMVYPFNELSDKAKEKALTDLYDINVDYGWWEPIYEDAEFVGLKLTHFDIGRSWDIGITLDVTMESCIDSIKSDHGDFSDTCQTAREYEEKLNELGPEPEDGDAFDVWEDQYYAIQDEFVKDMGQTYLVLLRNEYEYLTSEEAIRETIEATEYEFTEDGEIWS